MPQKGREKQQQQHGKEEHKKAQEKPRDKTHTKKHWKYWFSFISTRIAYNETPDIPKHTSLTDKNVISMGVSLEAFRFVLKWHIYTVVTLAFLPRSFHPLRDEFLSLHVLLFLWIFWCSFQCPIFQYYKKIQREPTWKNGKTWSLLVQVYSTFFHFRRGVTLNFLVVRDGRTSKRTPNNSKKK